MPWSADRPYNELPPLPPAGVTLETSRVLKATIAARAALAGLDQAATLLPNPQVLLNAASLLEAQASSEIENIVTTTDQLFRFADDQTWADPAAKEALRYRTALYEGVAMVRERPLSFTTCERVCSRIASHEMGIRSLAGTRIANPDTGAITYAPPEGNAVIRDKLSDWEQFLHATDDLDPVVRMAVAHYQFEAIHPFHDGNGRTGRIVNILMLIEAGLISEPVLYLSRAIIKTKNDYYRLLRGVTSDRAWEPWILFMANAVTDAAHSTLRKIGKIRALQDEMGRAVRAVSPAGQRAGFMAAMFEQPYSRIAGVMQACDVSRPTATKWLESLAAAGILTEQRLGRERLFINHRFLAVLEREDETPDREPDQTLF